MAEIGVISTLQEGVRALNRLANAVTPGPFSITNNFGDVVWSIGPYGQMFVHINISAPPSSFGNWDSILTAFTGDLSHVAFATRYEITGATTLGTPTTGYLYTPEAYPHVTYLYNESGHNDSASGNVGRTGAVAYFTDVFHAGQGDAFAYEANVFVASSRPGATHFFGNPAGTILGGQVTGGANGAYLQGIGDINTSDGGFDCASIGSTFNFNRTNDTGALQVDWIGARYQSIGSKAIGAVISAIGPVRIGIDLTTITFDASKIGVAMPLGARIYGNATNVDPVKLPRNTAPGTDWIERNSGGYWLIVNNNSPCLQISDGAAVVYPPTQFVSTIGFFNHAPAAKPTVTGSRGGNAALASLLTALAGLGLITDSSSP